MSLLEITVRKSGEVDCLSAMQESHSPVGNRFPSHSQTSLPPLAGLREGLIGDLCLFFMWHGLVPCPLYPVGFQSVAWSL